jgi:FKBP-type peptidyl-prolyl cis-trans isomerase 2
LSAEDAYGARSDDNLLRVARNAFPAQRQLAVGEALSIDFADGSSRLMQVREIGATDVLLDGNHALAGQELTFALRLDRILCGEPVKEKI